MQVLFSGTISGVPILQPHILSAMLTQHAVPLKEVYDLILHITHSLPGLMRFGRKVLLCDKNSILEKGHHMAAVLYQRATPWE